MRPAAMAWTALLLFVSLCGCASMATEGAAHAPEPAKPIDAARYYSGRWYEIERTPMSLAKDCVAGTTDYSRDAGGQLTDRDACRMHTPGGREKIFVGPITILNPGQNTKLRVNYKAFGVFTFPRTYWMLDHGDSYDWFIVSEPTFQNLSLFTRDPQPSTELNARLEARARQLGYDVSMLEHPAEFPAGMQ